MEDTAMEEPSMADAALMDDGMDAALDSNIDDLFGEATDVLAGDSLAVPLPADPLPPELVLRVTDMQDRGCCTQLAWSNSGSIARIEDDGARIGFAALFRNSRTNTWTLKEDERHHIFPSDDAKWVHIQFSNIGVDLAVVDTLGRVSVHTLTGTLGKMPLAPHNISRSENSNPDLDAVVALHWLPMYPSEFKFPNISTASRNGERWSTFMRQRDPSEPTVHHPAEGRQALLYVTRNTKLTLMFQAETGWNAVDLMLEDIDSCSDLVSHAAISEYGDSLLVLTHDLSSRFRLYKVKINWNETKVSRTSNHPSPPTVAPTLEAEHTTTLEHVAPQHAHAAKLTLLRIVASVPSNANDPDVVTCPTVFAVFTRASLPVDVTQQPQEAYSVVSRWDAEPVAPTLHEAFTRLKANGVRPSPQNSKVQLKRQEDIFTNKLVLSLESQVFHTVLALAASDGTCEFLNRVTMASIDPFPDPTSVSSLPQSGFEHVMDKHSVHVTMSGDGSSLAFIRPNGELGHKTMALRYTWQPLMDDGGLLEAAIVCVARQYTTLCCTSVSNDETLALLPPDLSPELGLLFIKQAIRMLGRNLDISMHDPQRQQMSVVREPLLHKAMSAQMIIGHQPGSNALTQMGKFAFAFLDMRLVAASFPQLLARVDLVSRADVLLSLRGLMKWGADMLVYIADGLVTLKRMMNSTPSDPVGEVCERFIDQKNSPVIYLLLCTFTRTYLRFLAMGIPKYLAHVQKLSSNNRSIAERQQLMEVLDTCTNLPFQYSDYEAFIIQIDTAIRDAYTKGTVPQNRRADIELSIICCEPTLAVELHPALTHILDVALPTFMAKADLAKLYMTDTVRLAVDSPREGKRYDVIRKTILTQGMPLRICKRCNSLMEDLTVEKARDLLPTLAHMGRHCVCGNYWSLE